MTGKAFRKAVEAHPDMEMVMVRGLDITIRNTKMEIEWTFPVAEVLTHIWMDFFGLFTCRRGFDIMIQQTRIVGYYSRVSNWNASKREELKDRHKGNYAVPA